MIDAAFISGFLFDFYLIFLFDLLFSFRFKKIVDMIDDLFI